MLSKGKRNHASRKSVMNNCILCHTNVIRQIKDIRRKVFNRLKIQRLITKGNISCSIQVANK